MLQNNLGLAVAYLGVKPVDFWLMLPVDFQAAMEGVREKRDIETRQAYELARFNAFLNIRPHLSEETQEKVNTPDKLYRFKWDAAPVTDQPLTPAEKHYLRVLKYGKAKAAEVTKEMEAKRPAEKPAPIDIEAEYKKAQALHK